jgi:drug/metabolite transporter (DMT)-like permease
MNNYVLYALTVLIWGSTWLAIKYQLGDVDPMVSVVYRFALAALLLLIYCRRAGLKMRFTLKEHLFLALQGGLLFSLNYWLVYMAEVYLTSGLVAVIFSFIVFMNVLNGYIFLRTPIRIHMVAGAVIGITGIALIFWSEITAFEMSDKSLFGLLLGFGAVFLASLGNITSARNQKHGLPVIQTNAYGMAYGTAIMLLFSVATGRTFSFSFSPDYVISLFYLAVFGSIAAFGFYLTLLGRIGADKAAYAIMLVPAVALCFSTACEGYCWTPSAFIGLSLLLLGNIILLQKKHRMRQTLNIVKKEVWHGYSKTVR